MHPEQKRILRAMEPEQKLKLSLRLYYSVRELKEVALRAQNPEWSEEKIKDQLRQIFLYAKT